MPTARSAGRQPSVLIIGAGFAGIGVAIALARAGFERLTILEKADDLGGVWRQNTYPGAGCDIPAPLYSYSFAPNGAWSRRFAPREDIHAYLRRTAAAHGVDRYLRLGTEAVAATFDRPRACWLVRTAAGAVLEADVLVPAVGQLSRPAVPAIPGAETFAGRAFHSARWDHDCDLTGRRVAVIGTGASAAQFVPSIQPMVERLTVFQRSAPYVLPKPDRHYRTRTGGPLGAARVAQLVGRLGFAGTFELFTLGLTVGLGPLNRAMTAVASAHLRRQVKDPATRAKLTPDYPMGCKRVLLSNDFYPALVAANTDIVTESIAALTPTGVRTVDGAEHPADVVIYGTGFTATEFLTPLRVTGATGDDLHETWADGARAYLGMAVPGYPNMFLMYGPNTNLGSGSIIAMIERQAGYVVDAVRRLATAGPGYLDVRPEVAAAFDAEMRRRLARTAWATCRSWYRDENGRITTNWPGLVAEYARRTRTLAPADYRLVRPAVRC